jgi:YD repeat-containing protein
MGWRSNHQRTLVLNGNSLTRVTGTGTGEPFLKVDGLWQGDDDSDIQITEDGSGFILTKENSSFENYDGNGRLLSTTDINGLQTTYGYGTNGRLNQVSNNYGHVLTLVYLNDRLESVIDPIGEVYQYDYDSNNNLIAVIFPDFTPGVITDNPRKIYHYENSNYISHLTGITDENGNRYATFAYDVNGKAIMSELGTTTNPVGQEKIELNYQGAN